MEHEVDIHLVHLPRSARHDSVCLRWLSVPDSSTMTQSLAGCWTLDNVVIPSTVGLPSQLRDDFDPVDLSNWMFYPGGRMEVCGERHKRPLLLDCMPVIQRCCWGT